MNSTTKLTLLFVLCLGLNYAFGQAKPKHSPRYDGGVVPRMYDNLSLISPMADRAKVHLSRSLNGKVVWSRYFRYWDGVAIDKQGNTLFNGEDLLYKISPAGKVLWTHPNEEVSRFGSDKKGNVFRVVNLEKDYHSDRFMVKIMKLSPTGKTVWVHWRSVKVPMLDGLNLTSLEGFRVTDQRLEIGFVPGPILYLDLNGKRIGQIDKPTTRQWKEVDVDCYGPLVDKSGAIVKVDIG